MSKSEHAKLIDDIADKQKNIQWYDTLRNGRNVDSFLWNGSPNPALVQRVGAFFFGLMFLIIGLLSLAVMFDQRLPLLIIVAAAMLYAGVRIFRNGFKRNTNARSLD